VAFSKSRQNLSEFSVLLLNRCVQLLSFVVVLPMLRRLPHYRCYLDAVQERTRVSISVKKATTDRGAVEPYEFGIGHFWQLLGNFLRLGLRVPYTTGPHLRAFWYLRVNSYKTDRL